MVRHRAPTTRIVERSVSLTLGTDEAVYLDGVLTTLHPIRLSLPLVPEKFLSQVVDKMPLMREWLSELLQAHPVQLVAETQNRRSVYHVVGMAHLYQLAIRWRVPRLAVRIYPSSMAEHCALLDGLIFPLFMAAACQYEMFVVAAVGARTNGDRLFSEKGHPGRLPIGPRDACLWLGIDAKTFSNIAARMRNPILESRVDRTEVTESGADSVPQTPAPIAPPSLSAGAAKTVSSGTVPELAPPSPERGRADHKRRVRSTSRSREAEARCEDKSDAERPVSGRSDAVEPLAGDRAHGQGAEHQQQLALFIETHVQV
jgi:hypothetical protein